STTPGPRRAAPISGYRRTSITTPPKPTTSRASCMVEACDRGRSREASVGGSVRGRRGVLGLRAAEIRPAGAGAQAYGQSAGPHRVARATDRRRQARQGCPRIEDRTGTEGGRFGHRGAVAEGARRGREAARGPREEGRRARALMRFAVELRDV